MGLPRRGDLYVWTQLQHASLLCAPHCDKILFSSGCSLEKKLNFILNGKNKKGKKASENHNMLDQHGKKNFKKFLLPSSPRSFLLRFVPFWSVVIDLCVSFPCPSKTKKQWYHKENYIFTLVRIDIAMNYVSKNDEELFLLFLPAHLALLNLSLFCSCQKKTKKHTEAEKSATPFFPQTKPCECEVQWDNGCATNATAHKFGSLMVLPLFRTSGPVVNCYNSHIYFRTSWKVDRPWWW